MAEEVVMEINESDADAAALRIYEVGYHIVPTVQEEGVEKVVAAVRGSIEKLGGSFIAEGAPALVKLAYPMPMHEGEKYVEYDKGYFGWIKFEAPIAAAAALNEALKRDSNILRHMVFQTVREDTRAKMKAPTLREVKRTDVIKAAPRRIEEPSVPVSEEDLDKALQDITVE